jgi:nitrogen-specific signal transduction histidine kinase
MVQVKKKYCCTKIPPGEIADNILNPLTSIKGYIQLILINNRHSLDDESLKLILSEIMKIEEAVNYLERLVDRKYLK